jgi:hypothetical protein
MMALAAAKQQFERLERSVAPTFNWQDDRSPDWQKALRAYKRDIWSWRTDQLVYLASVREMIDEERDGGGNAITLFSVEVGIPAVIAHLDELAESGVRAIDKAWSDIRNRSTQVVSAAQRRRMARLDRDYIEALEDLLEIIQQVTERFQILSWETNPDSVKVDATVQSKADVDRFFDSL